MPRSPRRKKRPAVLIGNTAKGVGIATGEASSDSKDEPPSNPAQQLGKLGGIARAKALSAKRRREIAKKAAASRWRR